MSMDVVPTSADTQAILLLTAPLLAGRRAEGVKPLDARSYQRIADHLRNAGRRLGDLLDTGTDDVRAGCADIVGAEVLDALLRRGMLLSQALDRWATRGIWVVSRADSAYPRRLLTALGTAAPPILYGAGDLSLLEMPALGVVGSRKAPDEALEVAATAGRTAARSGVLLMSGNAPGIDRTAMVSAAEAGGIVVAVLADGLERQVLVAENRDALHEGRLVVVSPYDPGVGRSIGLLMGRNKVIYGLSDAVLVADTKHREGGTWAGASEHLRRGHRGSVQVRVDEPPNDGQQALLDLGAIAWPRDIDEEGLRALLADAVQGPRHGDTRSDRVPAPRPLASEQLSMFAADDGS
jgi:DNA processing protein